MLLVLVRHSLTYSEPTVENLISNIVFKEVNTNSTGGLDFTHGGIQVGVFSSGHLNQIKLINNLS